MLQIRKKAENVFKHFNEQGDFMLSRGYFKLDNGVFQIVENGGARRFLYSLSEITVYDDTAGGTPETFTTDIELYERLVELRYNLVDTASGGFVSDLTSYPLDFPYVGSNTFVLPDNYVVVSVHVNIALQKKVTYSKTGNNLLVIGFLQTGDVVEVRGVIALGSFSSSDGSGGASTFLELSDTPSTYTGQAGKYTKVNESETGLEFAELSIGKVAVYSANKTLTPTDNNDTIFMDSGTLTINPSTQTYQDGYSVAGSASGVANTPIVLTAATDWTYIINGATAITSGSVFGEKGGTFIIIRKANLKIFQLNGSII